MRENSPSYDMIIVGGGLAGLITAWMCLDRNPDITVLVIEASERIGGDHTWSFNLSDVPESLREWIKPFIVHQWDQYDVIFPKRKRRLAIPYCSGNSDRLREIMEPFISNGRLIVLTSCRAESLVSGARDSLSGKGEFGHVTVSDGRKFKAKSVLDARGFTPVPDRILGYQKFVGMVVKTTDPHGLEIPIIMDATVPQIDGYRFVYCLPYGPDEMLIEDTYYADGFELDEEQVTGHVKDYARERGWAIKKVLRSEKGILPITLAVRNSKISPLNRVPEIGLRGGFYHAVTGYSLPDALKIADNLAYQIGFWGAGFNAAVLGNTMESDRISHIRDERFYRLLNRMLFRAAEPDQRYKVLQRFYGLSEPLIKRFYAGHSTIWDKIRILSGKPPVPISKALANFSERAFIKREHNEQ